MTLDLAQFHDIFFEESFEALDSMEAALLKLSAGDVDAELINTIFRVAHSIKGGSATFGFTDVAGFTHMLETLLDQLRAGKRQVDSGLVDVLLRSCDLMREMLGATQGQAGDRQGPRRHAARRNRTHHEATPASTAATATAAVRDRPGRRAGGASRAGAFRLAHPLRSRPQTTAQRQRPAAHPARTGDARNPARCAWMPSGVPPLADLDPEECRLPWNARGARASRAQPPIKAVFDWVEGECDLTIEAFGPMPTPP